VRPSGWQHGLLLPLVALTIVARAALCFELSGTIVGRIVEALI
jgi:hypothetical protein